MFVYPFKENAFASDLYENYRAKIHAQASDGEGRLPNLLLSNSNAFKKKLFKENSTKELFNLVFHEWNKNKFFDDTTNPFYKTFSKTSKNSFYSINSLVTPIPRIDGFFLTEISDDIVSLLLRSELTLPYTKVLKQILQDSNLNLNHPLRSILMPGGLAVVGNVQNSLLGLSQLAHELGHCLIERLYKEAVDTKLFLRSESWAHIMEEVVVDEYLAHYCLYNRSQHEQYSKDWWDYQRITDILSIKFYNYEIKEEASLFAINFKDIIAHDFSLKSLCFRESLFTIPGYHSVYVFATMQRWRWLALNLGLKKCAHFKNLI